MKPTTTPAAFACALFLFLVLASLAAPAASQGPDPADGFAGYVPEAMEAWDGAGLSVAAGLPNAAISASAGAFDPGAEGAAGPAEFPVAAQQSDGTVLVLTHATLIDGTGVAPRPDMTVVVRGDRIEEVFRSGERPLPEGAEVHDLTGRFLIPGLVSAHDHFMNAGLADSPDRIRAELRRMLYGGVTLARDANGDARLLAVLQRSLRLGEVVGPDIYYAAHMSGPDFIARDRRVGRASAGFRRGEPAWMQVVTRDTDVTWAVGRAAGTHATGLKLYVGVDADVIGALTREAHARGLLVWAHSTVFPDRPIEVVRAGVDAVSHLCWLAWQDEDLDPAANVPFTHTSYPEPRPSFDADVVDPDSPEMRLLFREMADRGTLLDATHSAYASGSGSVRGCTPELMTALARAAHRAGVPFVTGTDYYVDADEPFPSVHREIEYLVDRGVLSPLEVITAATVNGARLLGLGDTHGAIAPGKAASLVVLAEDPSLDVRALRTVVTVLHRGEWYPRDQYRPVGVAPSR